MINRFIGLGLSFLVFLGCDAQRLNPLDVHNPNRRLVSLSGRVSTFSLPHQPIEGVTVYSEQEKLLLITDANGYFSAVNLQALNAWLHFQKDGFHNDSLYLDWDLQSSLQKEVYLNALPKLDSLVFYSSLINRYPDFRILELFIRAAISDADNDIDSVFIQNNVFHYRDQLTYDTVSKWFEKMHISLAQLGVNSGEEIIGHPFELIVKDAFGRIESVGQARLQRIIRDEVDLKSPAGHEIVSTTPLLRWEPVNPGYDFTYRIEIRTDTPDPQLIWQKDGLELGSSSVQVDTALPTEPINSYIWAVWIIDNFGNRARSKYKSFQVQ